MFDRLVGNARAKGVLRRMLAQRRVPGALLFAGEESVGKFRFAVELAKALNCLTPQGVEACDRCSACARVPNFQPPPASDDKERGRHIAWSGHQDVGLLRLERSFITVEQAREVERESNFRPREGRARVFIIDPAERMNANAANALLKTLEDFAPTSHLILVTSRPASLLPTIRSRCQTVRFSPLAAEEIEKYLVATKRRAGEDARLVARLARGRLGEALELELDAYRERRALMFGVLEALAASPSDTARLLRATEELTDAKRKDGYESYLDALTALVRDAWLLSADPRAEIVNEDIRERLARLSVHVTNARAARWLSRVEELRAQLAVNVNRRAATDALFLSMAAA
ncbi:MAG: DNA polymerase III subunit delta' [Acidobacteria bacterium]|nr:DNA polymerase III subunit delta' [Acidobacteriota bacterium]